jgi:hypothetical protein
MMYYLCAEHYPTRKEYKAAIQAAKLSAEKVIRVLGGYMVFETAEDYRIWQQQQ